MSPGFFSQAAYGISISPRRVRWAFSQTGTATAGTTFLSWGCWVFHSLEKQSTLKCHHARPVQLDLAPKESGRSRQMGKAVTGAIYGHRSHLRGGHAGAGDNHAPDSWDSAAGQGTSEHTRPAGAAARVHLLSGTWFLCHGHRGLILNL